MRLIDRRDRRPFITKDKTKVRMFYRSANMSMAEAVVGVRETTEYHYHKRSTEIHYILEGRGVMETEGEERKVSKDQVIIIPRIEKHRIMNIGDKLLRFLCLSAPPYDDEGTIIVSGHKRTDYIIRYVPKKKRVS